VPFEEPLPLGNRVDDEDRLVVHGNHRPTLQNHCDLIVDATGRWPVDPSGRRQPAVSEAAFASASAQVALAASSARNGITIRGMLTPSTPRRRPW